MRLVLKHITLFVFAVALLSSIGSADWSSDIRLTNDPANSARPGIAVDSKDNLHIIWIDEKGPGVYYKKIDRCGNVLVEDKRIAYLTLTDAFTREELFRYGRPHICIDPDDNVDIVYINVYSDYSSGSKTKTIYYTKLDNNGNFLINGKEIETGELLRSPDIGNNSNGDIYVVWEGYPDLQSFSEVYYARLDKNSNFIQNPTRLTQNDINEAHQHGYPRIAIDQKDNVHVIWGNRASTGHSVLDKDDIKIVDNEELPPLGILGSVGGPWSDIGADAQGVPAVFVNGMIGTTQSIYYTKFNFDGTVSKNWNKIHEISHGGEFHPQIDIGPLNDLNLVWYEDQLSTTMIHYLKLDDQAAVLVADMAVTQREGNASYPDIAVDSRDCVHLVWQDDRDGNSEIYYKSSCPCIIPPPDKFDFGDAPDLYHTLLASNGARHTIVTGVHLGKLIDDEPDGQPTSRADGDDKNNLVDEDGVVFTSSLTKGSPATIKVTASVAGKLNAWLDFNKDEDWSEQNEQIFQEKVLVPGINTLTFNVPSDAVNGYTYARFRFNIAGGLSSDGPADDGEVEDYLIKIGPPTPNNCESSNSNSLEIGKSLARAIGFASATNNIKIVTNQQ